VSAASAADGTRVIEVDAVTRLVVAQGPLRSPALRGAARLVTN